MASLLIFAIGATMALSVYNFNAANRVDLEERLQAYEVAYNKLQTLLLRSKTDTVNWTANSNHNAWITPSDNILQIQNLTNDNSPFNSTCRAIQILDGSVNFLKSSGNSDYEWRYKRSDYKIFIKRTERNWQKFTEPVVPFFINNTGESHIVYVEVSWPTSQSDITNRKKVTLVSLAL